MRKITRFFAVLLAFATVFTFSAAASAASVDEGALQAEAQESGVTTSISSLSQTLVGITISNPMNYYVETTLYNYKKQVVDTSRNLTYVSFNIKKNKLYYYRVRLVDYQYSNGSSSYVPISDYSNFVAFSTATATVKKVSGGVKFKTPKVKGVKKWKLYMSTKSTGGWKKVKTVKAGKSVTIKKFKGKSFKKYKNYYYKLVSNKKEKVTLTSYFYIKTVYK